MQSRLLSRDNRLFELARQGQLTWPSGLRALYPYAVLAFALIAPLIGQFLALPLLGVYFALADVDPTQLDSALTAMPLGFAVLLIASFLPLFLLVAVWLRVFEKRPFWTIGLERGQALRRYLRGLLVGLALFGSAVLILALTGQVAIETIRAPADGGLLALGGAAIVLLGWVVQGAAEEVLARGFLLPVLGVRWGAAAGIVASAALFAALHLLNPNLNPIAVLNLFLFGVFAALYALYEGGLWGVFAIHSIWNWAQGNLFGFEVSGQEINVAILFDFMETGPDWLTGGPFGPEGGVVVTAVLLAACVAVVLLKRRRAERV